MGVPSAEGAFLFGELYVFAGCRCPGHALVPCGSYLAFNSAAGLLAVAYVLLHGLRHDAVGIGGLFPRRYAPVDRCYYGLDVSDAYFLDD